MPQRYITIDQIGSDHLIYVQYDLNPQPQREDLSDLIISEKIVGKPIPFALNSFWSIKPDFKLALLSAGYARLKDFNSAPAEYRAAQEKAQKEGRGDWPKPTALSTTPSPLPTGTPSTQPTKPPEGPSVSSQIGAAIYYVLKTLWDLVISPLGLASVIIVAIITYLYRRFYIQRRLRVLIIGEPSAGKTALFLRLLNPKIDEEAILKLGPSQALAKKGRRTFIAHGKYEIHPKLTDIPGRAPASVWDELTGFRLFRFRNPHALVVTLATTKDQVGNAQSVAKNQSYLDVQLGYVRAFIEGAMGARRTRKPKLIILYLNKFDLFSSQPPTDSSVANAREQFRKMFARHIESVENAAKKAGIPYRVVIGSALKNWNCEELIPILGGVLYGS